MKDVGFNFNGENLGRESREHVVPKVIDAHSSVGRETLEVWYRKTVSRLSDIVGLSQD